MRGRKPFPIACYQKMEDGSEVVIKNFGSRDEATEWSMKNKIMCKGAVQWTITHNKYLQKPQNFGAKYHNRDIYRFSRIANPNTGFQ